MFYAHSGTSDDKSDWQSLTDHLVAVAQLCAQMAVPLGLEKAAALAGLLHDLGKYTPEFQRRLTGADVRVDHSTAGAALLLGGLAKGRDKEIAELVAYCIAGHHAGLPDRLNETASCLNRRIEAPGFEPDPVWTSQLAVDPCGLVPGFTIKPEPNAAAFQYSVMTRMIFSCLVDAGAWIETQRRHRPHRAHRSSIRRQSPKGNVSGTWASWFCSASGVTALVASNQT